MTTTTEALIESAPAHIRSAWLRLNDKQRALAVALPTAKSNEAAFLAAGYSASTARKKNQQVPQDVADVAAARSQIGKPYDWPGVLGIGFRRNWQESDAWFCSELVAWAFGVSGSPLFRTEHWRITPQTIYAPVWAT